MKRDMRIDVSLMYPQSRFARKRIKADIRLAKRRYHSEILELKSKPCTRYAYIEPYLEMYREHVGDVYYEQRPADGQYPKRWR